MAKPWPRGPKGEKRPADVIGKVLLDLNQRVLLRAWYASFCIEMEVI